MRIRRLDGKLLCTIGSCDRSNPKWINRIEKSAGKLRKHIYDGLADLLELRRGGFATGYYEAED
jgi:hypothetical protein